MPADEARKTNATQPNPERPGHFDAFVGSSKAAISAILAVLCCNALGLPQAAWAAVSAVIVTQPTLHPSARASLMRVIANLIGAFVGAATSTFAGHSLWGLGLAILLTGLVCHLARAGDALRPAFAATVIVIFTTDAGAWHESVNRVLAVVVGCAATLAVGLACDKLARTPELVRPSGQNPDDTVE